MQLPQIKHSVACVAVALAAMTGSVAHADVVTFDVSGASSIGELGDIANEMRSVYIGSGRKVTGLTWDVTLSSTGGSYLSEMGLDFSASDGSGVSLFPGLADEFEGTESYMGGVDLAALGLSFFVGADGILKGTFFEYFADTPGAIEGTWRGSVMVSYVPEPATYGLAALGLLGIAATRRRRS